MLKKKAIIKLYCVNPRSSELSEAISSQIEYLSVEDLEDLGKAVFDFDSLEDLSNWLEIR